LSNTEFTTFVSNAWLGTRVEQSLQVEKVIRETLKTGRAVTLAQVRYLPDDENLSEVIESRDE
jgi:hypothetical protein